MRNWEYRGTGGMAVGQNGHFINQLLCKKAVIKLKKKVNPGH